MAEFQESLPRKLQYSQRNTDEYITNQKHSLPAYMLMHVVYFLSLIVLHRAYLPFLPLRCSEPVGPLDEPTFPREKYAVPEGFWRDSTKELFRAARQMMDLVTTCQGRGILVETPLVGFAVYNAAFMGIYAAHFSHMDIDGCLSSKRSLSPTSAGTVGHPQLPTRKSLDVLRDMRPRLGLATGWFRTLNRLHSYFLKVKKDVKAHPRNADGVDGMNGFRPVREGGQGGGLEEFKLLEKVFLDFGDIEDRIPEAICLEEDGTGQAIAMSDRGHALSDNGSNAVKSESGDSQIDGVAQQRRESWVPVNSSNTLPPGPDVDRPRSEMDRRPSLPMPSRGLSSQSPYSLPSIQHHNSISSTTSPGLLSLTATAAFSSAPPSQSLSQYAPNRLQPLNSWVTSHQQGPPASYSHSNSLPPINSTTSHSFPMLPPPGSVSYGGASSNNHDASDYPMWSTSLGGDDVVAFLDGGSFEQWQSISDSEIGYPTGWLSTVWHDL